MLSTVLLALSGVSAIVLFKASDRTILIIDDAL
jgi:hypothetical protein